MLASVSAYTFIELFAEDVEPPVIIQVIPENEPTHPGTVETHRPSAAQGGDRAATVVVQDITKEPDATLSDPTGARGFIEGIKVFETPSGAIVTEDGRIIYKPASNENKSMSEEQTTQEEQPTKPRKPLQVRIVGDHVQGVYRVIGIAPNHVNGEILYEASAQQKAREWAETEQHIIIP